MKISIKRKISNDLKAFISRIVLFFLYRGFKACYKFDKSAKEEIDSWNEGFTFIIETGVKNVNLCIKKENKKIVKIKETKNADIIIKFKSIDAAFLMFTGRLGVASAYAEHRFTLIGHAVGGISRVPHGDAMAILMTHCMRYNKDKLEEDYSKLLLYIAGEEVYSNTPKEQRADKTIEYIEEMLNKLNKLSGLKTKLSEAGVKEEDFDKIAKTAINDGAMIVNPKKANIEDVKNILKEAF